MNPIHTNTLSPLTQYLLQMGDNALILSHRLSEWCGHGPVLEQDIALTNIALDILGQSRLWYQLASTTTENKYKEDDFAYFREAIDFRNVLLVEQPNGDWGHTIVRQFIYDSFQLYFLDALRSSYNQEVSDIANKALTETNYHARWSSEWLIRLGDGTPTSHQKMQEALNTLWPFHQELIMPSKIDIEMARLGLGIDLEVVREAFLERLESHIETATLRVPSTNSVQKGGKEGRHSEHLGYILAVMQHLQRSMPDCEW